MTSVVLKTADEQEFFRRGRDLARRADAGAALGAQVTLSGFGHRQSLGHRAQVGEVVQAQACRACQRHSHSMSQRSAVNGEAQMSLCGMDLACTVSQGVHSPSKIPPQIRTIICGDRN